MSVAACAARLTGALLTMLPCEGRVHSAFEKAVNLALYAGGQCRLATLSSPETPKLPDSVCVPREALAEMRVGMPAMLSRDCLMVGERRFPLAPDGEWSGELRALGGEPLRERFLQLTEKLECGFDRLPPRIRRECEAALLTPDATRWLGLGSGLTPSYDDACVGVMALCRAAGAEPPFALGDLSVTTDVSARYLRLAAEGFFGQPVGDVAAALYGRGELAASVDAIRRVGATSGADMLHGMRLWLLSTFWTK